jgi:hypothetical protein
MEQQVKRSAVALFELDLEAPSPEQIVKTDVSEQIVMSQNMIVLDTYLPRTKTKPSG